MCYSNTVNQNVLYGVHTVHSILFVREKLRHIFGLHCLPGELSAGSLHDGLDARRAVHFSFIPEIMSEHQVFSSLVGFGPDRSGRWAGVYAARICQLLRCCGKDEVGKCVEGVQPEEPGGC